MRCSRWWASGAWWKWDEQKNQMREHLIFLFMGIIHFAMPRSRIFWSSGILILVLLCGAVMYFVAPLLQAPHVVAVEPADRARDILPTSPITITFSAPMNAAETEKSIRFRPRVDGAFTWRDSQTVILTPRATLPISKTITVQISRDARSWLGRPIEKPEQTRFTTLARPYLVHSTPALDARFVYVATPLRLTFNRALNPDALARSLTLTPLVQNLKLAWRANVLSISGFFEPRTRYRLTLPETLVDAEHGIPLGRIYSWTFETADQYPNFSVLNRDRVLKLAAGPLRLPVQFTNVSRLDIAVYSISPQEFDANADAPFETWYVFQPATAPAQTQRIATNAALDQYATRDILFDALPAGTYFLNITTPEGVFDARLLRVE